MKVYFGIGQPRDTGGPVPVYVADITPTAGLVYGSVNHIRGLEHHVLHSPDGFQWGYQGSGPADLARSLLWDVAGVEPPAWLYQEFKREFVAQWPMHEGLCWLLSEAYLLSWLGEHRPQEPIMEEVRDDGTAV